MGRLMVLLTLGVAGAALLPASASAGTLDQEQSVFGSGGYTISSSGSEAQTLTAGISGGLDRADLALTLPGPGTPTQDLIVEIRDAGPGGQILASQRVTPSSVTGTAAFVPVSFSPPASVVAGQQYAIVAWTFAVPFADYGWERGNGPSDLYPTGAAFTNTTVFPPSTQGWAPIAPPDDFAFKTYVTRAAPPGTTPAATTGAPPAAKARHCKHKKRHKSGAVIAKKCKKKAK